MSIDKVSPTFNIIDSLNVFGEKVKVDFHETNPEQQAVPPKKEEVVKAVKGLNDFISHSTTNIKFEFHEKLEEYYVTVVDSKTNEVVREIPSKKVLDLYSAMTEFIGLMVDKKI